MSSPPKISGHELFDITARVNEARLAYTIQRIGAQAVIKAVDEQAAVQKNPSLLTELDMTATEDESLAEKEYFDDLSQRLELPEGYRFGHVRPGVLALDKFGPRPLEVTTLLTQANGDTTTTIKVNRLLDTEEYKVKTIELPSDIKDVEIIQTAMHKLRGLDLV